MTIPPETTFLENVKGQYSKIEGLSPDKIAPTVGLNSMRLYLLEEASALTRRTAGKVTLPSTILHFQDLGTIYRINKLIQTYTLF